MTDNNTKDLFNDMPSGFDLRYTNYNSIGLEYNTIGLEYTFKSKDNIFKNNEMSQFKIYTTMKKEYGSWFLRFGSNTIHVSDYVATDSDIISEFASSNFPFITYWGIGIDDKIFDKFYLQYMFHFTFSEFQHKLSYEEGEYKIMFFEFSVNYKLRL